MAKFGIDRFAIARGYRIHYVELGKGHPLVLIPPSLATYHNWKKVAPKLAQHFRVLAVDYVGTGESDKPAAGFDYSPQSQSDVLADLLDSLNIERTYLMGVSYGGTIALNFAGRYPKRTEGIIAVEGFIVMKGSLWNTRQVRLLNTPLIGEIYLALVRSGLLRRKFARKYAGAWWDEMKPEQRREWIEYIAAEMRHANRPGWGGIFQTLFATKGDIDLRADARHIEAPVLLLIGGRSAFRHRIRPTVEFLRQEIPTAKVMEIPDGIHDMEWQKPDLLVRLALEFFKKG